MLARLGRVIYWFCCGIAALLAVIPVLYHGLPLMTEVEPSETEIKEAGFVVTDPNAAKGIFTARLASGVEYEFDLPEPILPDNYSNLDRIKRNVRAMFEKGKSEAEIDSYILSEGVSIQQLHDHTFTVVGKARIDKQSTQAMLAALRDKLITQNRARRSSQIEVFTHIVPLSLFAAIAIFLFGRGVRYVLANE